MKVLVTGGSGFIGKHLCKHLKEQGYEVFPTYRNTKIEDGWCCNLTSLSATRYMLNKIQPDVIVHCAANPNPKHPEAVGDMLNDNVLTTLNLLESAPEKSQFIFLSSISVYGNGGRFELPSTLYGATKLCCEKIMIAYSQLKELDTHSIRTCAVVGPDTTHGLLYDIRRKLKSDSPELELFGDEPGTSKPYVHVNDLVSFISNIIKSPRETNFFLLNQTDFGPDGCISVKEIAEAAMEVLNIHKPIKWLGSGTIWKGDNMKLEFQRMFSTRQSGIGITRPSIEAIKDAF